MRVSQSSVLFASLGALTVACTEARPAEPSRLCVVRHAEAYKNLDPRPAALSDEALDALTPEGLARTAELRATLPAGKLRAWASPTRRTRQTAEGLRPETLVVEPALRSLDGAARWAARKRAAAEGRDLSVPDGESLADGAKRAQALLSRVRAALAPGEHAVLVTHGDLAPLLLGALRGTPLLERPARDGLETGQMACAPLD